MLSLPPLALLLIRFFVPLACGVAASVIDTRERKIPNWLSVPLAAAALVIRGVWEGWPGLLDLAGGFALGFGVLFLMWLVGTAGGGDVKFMGAVGAWIGPFNLLFVFVLSAILLAVYAFAVLFAKMISGKRIERPNSDNLTKTKSRSSVPYALPLTLALALRLAWKLAKGDTA